MCLWSKIRYRFNTWEAFERLVTILVNIHKTATIDGEIILPERVINGEIFLPEYLTFKSWGQFKEVRCRIQKYKPEYPEGQHYYNWMELPRPIDEYPICGEVWIEEKIANDL